MFVCKASFVPCSGGGGWGPYQGEANVRQGTWQQSMSLSGSVSRPWPPPHRGPYPRVPTAVSRGLAAPGGLYTGCSLCLQRPFRPCLSGEPLSALVDQLEQQPSHSRLLPQPKWRLLFWVHPAPCKRLLRDLVTTRWRPLHPSLSGRNWVLSV